MLPYVCHPAGAAVGLMRSMEPFHGGTRRPWQALRSRGAGLTVESGPGMAESNGSQGPWVQAGAAGATGLSPCLSPQVLEDVAVACRAVRAEAAQPAQIRPYVERACELEGEPGMRDSCMAGEQPWERGSLALAGPRREWVFQRPSEGWKPSLPGAVLHLLRRNVRNAATLDFSTGWTRWPGQPTVAKFFAKPQGQTGRTPRPRGFCSSTVRGIVLAGAIRKPGCQSIDWRSRSPSRCHSPGSPGYRSP